MYTKPNFFFTTFIFPLFFLYSLQSIASSPLEPVRTDHPRDTMMSFMEAMNDYKKGLDTGDRDLRARLSDAVRTLNLSDFPAIVRAEKGRESAILLKEVIDRIILIDYNLIPDDPNLARWRLKSTEIVLSKVESGERAGEFLFSSDTVQRASEFYNKVKHLPYLKGSGQGAGYREPFLERSMPEWSRGQLLGFQKWQWVGLFIVILLGFLIKLSAELLTKLFKKLTQSQTDSLKYQILLALEKPIGLVVTALFWFASVHSLRFEGTALAVLVTAIQIVWGVGIVWSLYKLTEVFNQRLQNYADHSDNNLDSHLVPLLGKTLRVFVMIFGVLVVIQNLGINVMSLLAGLGIGGLALALAAKDTAANFFGSIMILLDRPFRVGDWIVTGSTEGLVEEVGFRSTRIRTFYGSLISIPNSELATANIDNMGKRDSRRTLTELGLTYDTPPEKIEAFVEGVKNIIKANPATKKDAIQVAFNRYGDFSLQIIVVFFLKVDSWGDELIERQNIYNDILRLAREIGVEFAFPTQTLHMESFPEKKPTRIQEVKPIEELKLRAKEFGPDGKFSHPMGLGIFTPRHKEPPSSP